MSYPRELDEYSEEELLMELNRRAEDQRNGLCDYCRRPAYNPTCRFPKRHKKTIRREDE